MNVVIIHRSADTGHGLALILEKYEGIQVVAEVSDNEKAIPVVLRGVPDLILLGSEFSELALEATLSTIGGSLPDTRAAVLKGSDDWSRLEASIRAGAGSKTRQYEIALPPA